LSPDLNEAELAVDCLTKQGIAVHLKAVVIYKSATILRRSPMPRGGFSISKSGWIHEFRTYSPAICERSAEA